MNNYEIEKNIDVKVLENQMKKNVAQYKKAAKDLSKKGYYLRGRCLRPIEGKRYHKDLYIATKEGVIKVCYNTTAHRVNRVLCAILNNQLENIDTFIFENYITNGYTTRKGLFANYENKKEKIQKIAKSHADYIGCEISSTTDHYNRVQMRK